MNRTGSRRRNDGDDACERLMDATALGSDAQQKVLQIATLIEDLASDLDQQAGNHRAAAGSMDAASREIARAQRVPA